MTSEEKVQAFQQAVAQLKEKPGERKRTPREAHRDDIWGRLRQDVAPATSFVLDRLEMVVQVDMQGKGLRDIFNEIVPTVAVPYVFLEENKIFFAKLRSAATLPPAWTEREPQNEGRTGLYFRIKRLGSREHYNSILWEADPLTNTGYITFLFHMMPTELLRAEIPSEGSSELQPQIELLKKTLADVFRSYPVTEQKTTVYSIGGTFTVSAKLSRAIFADFVTSDVLAQEYLFFDEYQRSNPTSGDGSVLNKKHLSVYFDEFYADRQKYGPSDLVQSPGPFLYADESADPSTAVRLFLIPKSASTVSVRLTRAASLAAVALVRRVLCALLGRYQRRAASIVEAYAKVGQILPLSQFVYEPASKAPEPKRLRLLKDQRPDLFVHGVGADPQRTYALQCQAGNQPRLLVGKRLKDLHLKKNRLGPRHAMEYPKDSGDWYVCAPRDKEDKQKDNLFPGLKVNTSRELPASEDLSKLLPCCYKTSHYTKGKPLFRYQKGETLTVNRSGLLKWPNGRDEGGPRRAALGYKQVSAEATGKLPLNLEVAWSSSVSATLVRFGVKFGPKSFLSCLAKATASSEGDVKSKIEDELHTSVVFQETYGISENALDDQLSNAASYADARVFVGAAEGAFKCKIFLYQVTRSYPKGDVDSARAAFVLLPSLPQANAPPASRILVLVLQEQRRAISFPFQCELVGRQQLDRDEDGDRDSDLPGFFFPADSALATKCRWVEAQALKNFQLRAPPPNSEIGESFFSPWTVHEIGTPAPPGSPWARGRGRGHGKAQGRGRGRGGGRGRGRGAPVPFYSGGYSETENLLWNQFEKASTSTASFAFRDNSCFYDAVLLALVWNRGTRQVVLYEAPGPPSAIHPIRCSLGKAVPEGYANALQAAVRESVTSLFTNPDYCSRTFVNLINECFRPSNEPSKQMDAGEFYLHLVSVFPKLLMRFSLPPGTFVTADTVSRAPTTAELADTSHQTWTAIKGNLYTNQKSGSTQFIKNTEVPDGNRYDFIKGPLETRWRVERRLEEKGGYDVVAPTVPWYGSSSGTEAQNLRVDASGKNFLAIHPIPYSAEIAENLQKGANTVRNGASTFHVELLDDQGTASFRIQALVLHSSGNQQGRLRGAEQGHWIALLCIPAARPASGCAFYEYDDTQPDRLVELKDQTALFLRPNAVYVSPRSGVAYTRVLLFYQRL